MDIRYLRLFKHLAESLHFGQTSRACNITPSALTRTIQRLEAEIGQSLFIRDNRSVELSPTGILFKNYADETITRWEDLQNDLSHDDKLSGEISLYCSVTAAYTILPKILGKFRKVYPHLLLNLHTGDAAQALRKLENSEVDITIAALPERLSERITFLNMLKTPLVFISSATYPETVIYKNKEIDWQKTPVILAERGLSRDRTEQWFTKKQIIPNIYAQVAGNEALIAMVSLGYGVGVVPKLVLEKSPMLEQINILAVTPWLKSFTIGLCTMAKKIANPKIKAFWEIAALEKI